MMVLVPAAAALSVVMIAAWWWQRRVANGGWVDAFWTFGLGGVGAMVALIAGHGARSWLVALLIGAWALRLGMYIAARTRSGPEDTRYAQFRVDWGASFQVRMFWFLQIQAAAAAMLLVPVYLAAVSPRPLGWVDGVAVAVAVVAVLGEALADRQMHAFRRDHHGKVCDAGLWGLCRHPNYFFEWLYWVTYPLLAAGAPWGWLALIGPAAMYWLLVHVSGIPPLEAQMLRRRGDAYRDYQRRVRAFVPIPKGKSA